ncbi:MAG: class I SAM-dependent methyltransferase, partial [Eubacterium sp.]|nr:class I SAM-dependent methyltransferase [Eubacterium sp.]
KYGFRKEKMIKMDEQQRVFGRSGGGYQKGAGAKEKVRLCHCKDCTFSFYDRRLSDKEASLLYEGYRDEEYQKLREACDCWYTAKVNDAMNHDRIALSEQRRVIGKMVTEHIRKELAYALDFGGNRGESFTKRIGTKKKYVYDISGVETVPGVERISDAKELARHSFDFIMCNMTLEHVSDPKALVKQLYGIGSADTYYYMEVPSENPFETDKFSVRKNLELLLNPNYSKRRLVQHYFRLKRLPYMPMSEHINFYTPKALKTLLSLCGFEVLAVQEHEERTVLGKAKVLSAVCRKKK